MIKSSTKDRIYKTYQIAFFVFLSYLITWIYTVPEALESHNIISFKVPFLLEIIGALGPAVAAIAIISLVGEKGGVLKLLSGIRIWKVEIKWYLITLLGQPVIWMIAILIYTLFSGQRLSLSNTHIQDMVMIGGTFNLIMFIVIFFLQQFVSLLGEEIGWRGYLLPKLLKTKHWITSSLIIGLIWALWHLPLFYIQGRTQVSIPLLWYFIDLMASTIFFTWIFINTRGSVLIATLFHTSINTSTVLLPILPIAAGNSGPFVLGVCLKLIIAILVIFLKKDDFNNKAMRENI